ncbi:MAG: alpha/beta hydrolase [Nostoc sp.]|uniref:alpha/beta fold hydrolase n=1 Tax=Nostoc sp. TaxID=1180 RepID=UPI002FFC9EFA
MIRRWTTQNYPPPGQLIDIEGNLLHLHSLGEAKGKPTVILEAGLLSMSAIWAWVQPEIAKLTRVVAYDRPGLGWSEPNKQSLNAQQVAVTLQTALKKVGIEPPYILVGHSMGGQLIRVFTDLYPDEVVGMILIDSSHPDQRMRSPAIAQEMKKLFNQLQFLPILAKLGILRLTGLMQPLVDGLPSQQQAEAIACCSSTQHLKTSRDELLAWDLMTSQVRNTRHLGDLPLTILTADSGSDPVWAGWSELQADLANLSSQNKHRIATGANHLSLLTHKQDAQAAIAAICEMLEAVSMVISPQR